MDSTATLGAAQPPAGRRFSGSGFPISGEMMKIVAGTSLGLQTTTHSRLTFTYMFTVSLLCTYSGPVILAWQLGMDPDAAFFIGHYGKVGALIPVFILIMHLVIISLFSAEPHRVKKRTFIVTAVLPAVLLALIGGHYMTQANYWRDRLTVPECSAAIPEKNELQQAYEQAEGLQRQCKKQLTKDNGDRPLWWQPTLQSCIEMAIQGNEEVWKPYKTELFRTSTENHQLFSYLASVEANHICGGFCEPGPMLWNNFDSVGRMGSRCAPMVGNKMRVVSFQGIQLLTVSLTGISFFFFVWGALSKKLRPFLDLGLEEALQP